MVSGSSDGIRLGAVNGALGTGGSNSLIVLQGGSVSGTFRDGVSLSGNGNSLINSGVISGAFGISSGWFDTNTATNSTISNSGQILGVEAGIVAFQGNTTIDNSGLISSGDSLGLFDSSILLERLSVVSVAVDRVSSSPTAVKFEVRRRKATALRSPAMQRKSSTRGQSTPIPSMPTGRRLISSRRLVKWRL